MNNLSSGRQGGGSGGVAARQRVILAMKSARKGGPRRFGRLAAAMKQAGRAGGEPMRYISHAEDVLTVVGDFSKERSHHRLDRLYSALCSAYDEGARNRGRVVARRFLSRRNPNPQAADFIARPLVEAIAWAAHLRPHDVERVVREELEGAGFDLSPVVDKAVSRWAETAVLERSSRLEWVPAGGEAWPEPANDSPFVAIECLDAPTTANAPPSPLIRNANGVLDLRPRLRAVEFAPDVDIAPPSWLVKGLVPKCGISLLYGESAAGKTFLAIHLALATAWGLRFFGQRVRQGGVVYVAAESGAGVLSRMRAAEVAMRPAIDAENLARRAQGLGPLERAPIVVITEAPDLGPNGSPKPLIATIEDAKASIATHGHRLGLAIVDTWHAALGGGDDNSSAETGGALRPLRELCDLHGLATLIVHHPGKDTEKGARGSSALPAAADAIIALVVEGHTGPRPKPSSATRRLTATKMRDGESGIEATYRLAVVELGVDEDGDAWTTCVVEPLTNAQQGEPGRPRLSAGARDLQRLLSDLVGEGGRVNLFEARQRFMEATKEAKPDSSESAHRMAWKRASEALEKAGAIAVFESENWIQVLNLDP